MKYSRLSITTGWRANDGLRKGKEMKRFLWFGMSLWLAAPLWAATATNVTNATDSLHFSTKPGADWAWQLTRSGSQWTLSFAPDALVVDNTHPSDAKLQGDFVQLPTLTITGITERGNFLVATLNSGQSLTISSDTDNTAVFTALMKAGGLLAVGTNTAAYSQPDGSLSIKSFDKSYGVLVPALGSDQTGGLLLDLNFSGDAIRGGNLFDILRKDSGTLRGTLSGQISAISAVPEPATLLLLGLGAILAGRWRPGSIRNSLRLASRSSR
jgi:hypothetical protein